MSDDSVFSRWSRRKRQVAAEDAPAPVEETPAEPVADAAPDTPEEEAALLERLGLPAPETLAQGDDFSAFMRAGVPEFLRKRALRVLWRSNPVLANLDGLNDYDEDFTSPQMTQKVLATAYKVGRGILREIPVETADAGDEPAPEVEKEEAARFVDAPTEAPPSAAQEEVAAREEVEEPIVRPRRMRFEI